jgi:hypothetical protein
LGGIDAAVNPALFLRMSLRRPDCGWTALSGLLHVDLFADMNAHILVVRPWRCMTMPR